MRRRKLGNSDHDGMGELFLRILRGIASVLAGPRQREHLDLDSLSDGPFAGKGFQLSRRLR